MQRYTRYTIAVGGKEYVIDVKALSDDRFRVRAAGRDLEVHLVSSEPLPSEEREETAEAGAVLPPERSRPSLGGQSLPSERQTQAGLTAPMPGTVLSLHVVPGETIRSGQVVLILEAMKMKNSLQAPQDGVVAEVLVQPGQRVNTGDLLIRFAG